MRLLFLRTTVGDAEQAAALAWARERGWDVCEVPADALDAPLLAAADVTWCHAGSEVPVMAPLSGAVLAGAVAGGHHVVLSLLATPLASSFGATGEGPVVEGPRRWRHDEDARWPAAFRDWPGYPHIRGFQGWGDHPLFTGMQRGTFTWMAREGDRYARAVFSRPRWPAARVVAVDRSYVHLHAEHAVAWEYELGRGRVTCLGANLYFCAGDPLLHAQRDALLANALADAAPTAAAVRTGWPGVERQHAAVAPTPRPRAIRDAEGIPRLQPSVVCDVPDESPVTLGWSHGLIVGTVAQGVKEVWIHPLCVVGAGVSSASAASELACVRATVSAVHLEREMSDATGATWRELVVGADDEPEVVYTLSPVGAGAEARPVAVELRLPLRLEWPMPPDALTPLRAEVRRDGTRASVVVTGRDGQHVLALFVDGADELTVRDDDAAPAVTAVSRAGEALRIAVRASVNGTRGLSLASRDAGLVLQAREAALTRVRQGGTGLLTGDHGLDEAWTWAVARLANFMAEAPGGTRGLMAGFAGSRPGWNASRPGYAWFFGRDACWSVDALLAAGLFDEAREAIALLAGTADVTGKVIHELTTSGVAHYDAADSTPLFLRAVCAHAEWTGDRESLAQWWPAVERAFAFVCACDRDGDGLPENTGIGHGWIEMGPLGGGHVTSYVAAIWIDTLRRLAPVCDALGEAQFAARVRSALAAAERGLHRLRLGDGRLALHCDARGILTDVRTALSAVPIALGVDASSSVDAVLSELDTPRFTTAWGLRLLPNDDPRYDPTAYHAGSVWPLFTGWAALADCRAGFVDRGLSRVRSLARGARAGGTGGFAEVLHGDNGARAGVCPDQAWSAAMLITPLVSGIAAVRPDALCGRYSLGMRLPAALPRLDLRGLRLGTSRVDAHWARSGGATTLTVTHVEGPAVVIDTRAGGESCHPGQAIRFTATDEGGR